MNRGCVADDIIVTNLAIVQRSLDYTFTHNHVKSCFWDPVNTDKATNTSYFLETAESLSESSDTAFEKREYHADLEVTKVRKVDNVILSYAENNVQIVRSFRVLVWETGICSLWNI